MSDTAEALLPLLTAHCFWWPRCTHSVANVAPNAVHDGMERHYAEAHEDDIRQIEGRWPHE